MDLLSIALSLFILMDPIGNVPLYLAFLKEVNPKRQRIVILRELLIALLVILLFTLLGDYLLALLKVSEATISIAGAIILFLIALKMIFPTHKDQDSEMSKEKEPFIVPLAIPFIAGPAVLAAVMLYSHQEKNLWIVVTAIFLAWIASTIILLLSTFLKKILGVRGLTACERLMGLILTLISVQMFFQGLDAYLGR